jgi:hypothetical protein
MPWHYPSVTSISFEIRHELRLSEPRLVMLGSIEGLRGHGKARRWFSSINYGEAAAAPQRTFELTVNATASTVGHAATLA